MSGLRVWIVVVCFIGLADSAFAVFEKDCCGPRATGLGGAGVALSGDAWCASRNPALLNDGLPLVGLAWQRLFDLPELTRLHLAGEFILRRWAASLQIHQFGGELYRESAVGVSLARSFSSFVSVGGEVSVNQVAIRQYGDAAAFGISLGVCCHPVPELSAAACWRNFPQARFGGWNARMPEALQLGVALRLPRGTFAFDVVEEPRFPAEYRIGAEAPVLPALSLRIGARAEPVRPSAGFTVRVSRWRFHYAGDLHPDLGPSHELGLEVDWR